VCFFPSGADVELACARELAEGAGVCPVVACSERAQAASQTAADVDISPVRYVKRIPGAPPEYIERESRESQASRPSQLEGKNEQADSVAVAEMVAHLRDFGITTFAQVATLTEEGLRRRLGSLGGWLYSLANGADISLVVPDAPPISQNARVRFHHAAEAEETCIAIRKLADYLGERLVDQRLKGRAITLMMWPGRYVNPETRKLAIADDSEEIAVVATEEAIVGQMMLPHYTDDADRIAYQLFQRFGDKVGCLQGGKESHILKQRVEALLTGGQAAFFERSLEFIQALQGQNCRAKAAQAGEQRAKRLEVLRVAGDPCNDAGEGLFT